MLCGCIVFQWVQRNNHSLPVTFGEIFLGGFLVCESPGFWPSFFCGPVGQVALVVVCPGGLPICELHGMLSPVLFGAGIFVTRGFCVTFLKHVVSAGGGP